MRRCNSTDQADFTIDNIPYRLEQLAEAKTLRHLVHLRGVVFLNPGLTLGRLEKERQTWLRRRREERRKQRASGVV